MTARRYALEFTPAAARRLHKLDRRAAALIRKATEALRDDPRPHGVKALAGRRGQLRIRVGDYRVIYTVQDDRLVVLVLELGHRRDVYERSTGGNEEALMSEQPHEAGELDDDDDELSWDDDECEWHR